MQEFTQGLGQAWANVAEFIPLLIGFLLILIIGYFVAKLIQKASDAVLEKVGFDKWVERGGVKKALSQTKYDASSLLAKLVFYLIMLFVLQLAFGVFGQNPISELIQGVIAYLPSIFAAILIIVVGSAIAAAVKEIVSAALAGLSYGKMLAAAASVAILTVTIFAALTQLNIAEPIVVGLFYALLAVVAGSAIVAFGGGGIPVARQYLQRWSQKADQESQKIKQQVQHGGKERVQERMKERQEQMKPGQGKSQQGGSQQGKSQQGKSQQGGSVPVESTEPIHTEPRSQQ